MCCVALFSAPLAAREFAVGLLSVADDERYSPRAIEKGYPEAPNGRSAVAAQLALEDAGFMLQSAGWSKGRLVAVEAPDQAGLPAALEGLLKQGVRHVVLELPASGVTRVTAAARGKDLLLVNAAAPEDVLRAASAHPTCCTLCPATQCSPMPSRSCLRESSGTSRSCCTDLRRRIRCCLRRSGAAPEDSV
jgi:hypothetical protein